MIIDFIDFRKSEKVEFRKVSEVAPSNQAQVIGQRCYIVKEINPKTQEEVMRELENRQKL